MPTLYFTSSLSWSYRNPQSYIRLHNKSFLAIREHIISFLFIRYFRWPTFYEKWGCMPYNGDLRPRSPRVNVNSIFWQPAYSEARSLFPDFIHNINVLNPYPLALAYLLFHVNLFPRTNHLLQLNSHCSTQPLIARVLSFWPLIFSDS